MTNAGITSQSLPSLVSQTLTNGVWKSPQGALCLLLIRKEKTISLMKCNVEELPETDAPYPPSHMLASF